MLQWELFCVLLAWYALVIKVLVIKVSYRVSTSSIVQRRCSGKNLEGSESRSFRGKNEWTLICLYIQKIIRYFFIVPLHFRGFFFGIVEVGGGGWRWSRRKNGPYENRTFPIQLVLFLERLISRFSWILASFHQIWWARDRLRPGTYTKWWLRTCCAGMKENRSFFGENKSDLWLLSF